jgi:signal transduction histidine kinase
MLGAAQEGPHSRRSEVWIVDDSDLQAELGRRALADTHEVRVFRDGGDLLEALGTGGSPDLLVVDWHMPTLSGLDICRFVRETRDAGSLPILILTATGGPDLAEAFQAGANDFVLKPFSRTELEARVSALVRNRDIHSQLAAMEGRLRVEGEFRELFIGMLAHDLRQPLHTLVLASRTLQQMVPTSPLLTKLFGTQERASGRMGRMIAELLDFTRSRPESGMPIERRPMDLESLTRAVLDESMAAHPERSFRLTTDGPCPGSWDHDRLWQVCTNLLGNAVEHSTSPSSPIDVTLMKRGDQVELMVSNEGTPIPSNLLPHLFEPFRRGRGASPSAGLGLGLHIVQQIARAHGGSVDVQSDRNATVFRVTLPTDPALSSRQSGAA